MCLSAVMVPTIRVIRLMLENAWLSTIVGREPNTHEHACQSNLSMFKVLPVRKKPCQLKPFSSVRKDHRRSNFYLKIKIEIYLYSMKIKEQTRKLAVGCSKHCFEVVDKTDEVSSKHCFEVVDRTDEVSTHTYGKAKLTWFEEIFEEYQLF